MASLVSISVIPNDPIIYLGDTVQYQVIATYDNGQKIDVTDLSEFSLNGSPSIAEFSLITPGLLSSFLVGTEVVTIDYLGETVLSNLEIHNPLIVAQAQDLVGRYQPDVDYYLGLITSEYQNSPKLLHWVRTYLEVVNSIKELAENLSYYLSFFRIIDPKNTVYIQEALTVKDGDFVFAVFDACVGDQLDIIGEIVGQKRTVYFKADDDLSPPEEAVNYTFTDDEYRVMLKNRVIVNRWDGKSSSLQAAWAEMFSGSITIQDNQNMTVDIIINVGLTDTFVRAIKNDYIVPRPQGVLYTYYYGDLPYFGFDRDDDFVSGYDKGHWAK